MKQASLATRVRALELDVLFYNAMRPNAGNEIWLLQATLTYLLPH
jgi:hypothetical protein